MDLMKPKIILASSSPWRRALFKLYTRHLFTSENVNFLAPNIDEKSIRDPDPFKLVQMIAEAKMDHILANPLISEADFVITCDQVVTCGNETREKPVNADQAKKFLSSYAKGEYGLNEKESKTNHLLSSSGTEATCVNGIVVHDVKRQTRVTKVDTTTIAFDKFPDAVIDEMSQHPVTLTTAGGFDSNTLGKFITDIRGSFPSAEGWPIYEVLNMMTTLDPDAKIISLTPMGEIQAILFDMDGLLLDTERLYSVAQQKILDRFNITFTPEVKDDCCESRVQLNQQVFSKVKAMMMGRKALDSAKIMIEHYKLEGQLDPEEFIREREAILDQLFPDCDLMPGVKRLLLHLKRHLVPMAIATSSHKRHFDLKTSKKHAEFFKLIFGDNIITGDQVKQGKPDPEIFLTAKALALSGQENVPNSAVLVFEDSPLGISAGVAAGMKTVLVCQDQYPCPNKPDMSLSNMFYFLPEQWGLPRFD